MYKKTLFILLAIFSFLFLGCGLLENEKDAEKLMKYVDCDEFYVGTYTGVFEGYYSDLMKWAIEYQGYKRGHVPEELRADRQRSLAIFVDIDRNVTVEGDYAGTSFTLSGYVNTDGSFEATGSGATMEGQFAVDEETLNVSAQGTWSLQGVPGSWRADAFDVNANCFISEEIFHDFSNEDNIVKEIDAGEKTARIKAGEDTEIILKTNTRVEYNRRGEDIVMEELRGQMLGNHKGDRINFEVRSPQAVLAVRGTKFSIKSTQEYTTIFVEQGEVEVSSLNEERIMTLTDGEMVTILENFFPEQPIKLY